MSIPPGFSSLSEKEQRIKLMKKQQIEQHWRCTIRDAIPQDIRPRVSPGKSVKAKVGYPAAEAEWWRWSVDLFYKLENFAAMTAGRWPFAQALMQAEVRERQRDYTNGSRETAEILKQDVVKMIAELKERGMTGGGYDTEEDEDDEDEFEDELDEDEGGGSC